jgi:hypothetical protein
MILSKTSPNQFSPVRVIYLLGTTAMLLMIVNVFMSARVAQDGLAVADLIKTEAKLKTEITLLEQELLNATSLQDLSVKAKELGYQEPTSVITVTSNNRIAQF